jgi:hypothetical protein
MRLVGFGLFAFIPLVLWLFVAHPAPIGLSLAAGVVLMLGHRFLARPYLKRVRTEKCLWCNRMPLPPGAVGLVLENRSGQTLEAFCCPRHAPSAGRFFAFLARHGRFLAIGIFVPLGVLLGSLLAAALGRSVPLDAVVRFFQTTVGLTVSLAAWGYRLAPPGAPAGPLVFPLHNFFLLGVRGLLWIFRIVGAWWVLRGFGFLP